MNNSEIAKIFYEIADLLEIKEVQFKPRAYRNAARTIESLSESIADLYKSDKPPKLPGIGVNIAKKIKELVTTGKLEYLENLKSEFPPILIKLLRIPGIGPKTVKLIKNNLQINTIHDLISAIKHHKIRNIKGLGPKTEELILKYIDLLKDHQKRHLLFDVISLANKIKEILQNHDSIIDIEIAGSIRRKKETVKDIDLVCTSNNHEKTMEFFTTLPDISEVKLKGLTRCSVVISNISIDLRIVDKDNFGSALLYLTGSKEHNIALRKLANSYNFKLNEYGLFGENSILITSKTENDIYKKLNMQWIPPELRENRGEIEAAQKNQIPELITFTDIQGDFHIHTHYSDGNNSIQEIASHAKSMGYQYICISDHTKGYMPGGLGVDKNSLQKQIDEINRLNETLDNFIILKGVEANILPDGKLDIPNNLLKDLDIVIASLHSGLRQDKQKITNRIITAMSNDYVNILGHPTCRLINKRPPIDLELPLIVETAVNNNILLEINAYPNRLDLNDINTHYAVQHQCKLAIGTDAHSLNHLKFMEFGIYTARRGWASSDDIINSLTIEKLKHRLNI
ncbi:MAG: DNA polymerase/3'-5' exonuclease PolX [Candidatus Helarchaeota archaeon]